VKVRAGQSFIHSTLRGGSLSLSTTKAVTDISYISSSPFSRGLRRFDREIQTPQPPARSAANVSITNRVLSKKRSALSRKNPLDFYSLMESGSNEVSPRAPSVYPPFHAFVSGPEMCEVHARFFMRVGF
jgi:hypothetical protein